MSKPFARFFTFSLAALLLLVPAILTGCTEEQEGDPRNTGKPGNVGCDEHCMSNYWEGLLECELEWNHCMDACNNDESCEDLCYDDWGECEPFTAYYYCAQDCNACIWDYFNCLVQCDYDDDDYIDACYDAYIGCGEWNRSCWDGCDQQYSSCIYDCPNYTCMDDCDEEYYGNCLPGCLDTN